MAQISCKYQPHGRSQSSVLDIVTVTSAKLYGESFGQIRQNYQGLLQLI